MADTQTPTAPPDALQEYLLSLLLAVACNEPCTKEFDSKHDSKHDATAQEVVKRVKGLVTRLHDTEHMMNEFLPSGYPELEDTWIVYRKYSEEENQEAPKVRTISRCALDMLDVA